MSTIHHKWPVASGGHGVSRVNLLTLVSSCRQWWWSAPQWQPVINFCSIKTVIHANCYAGHWSTLRVTSEHKVQDTLIVLYGASASDYVPSNLYLLRDYRGCIRLNVPCNSCIDLRPTYHMSENKCYENTKMPCKIEVGFILACVASYIVTPLSSLHQQVHWGAILYDIETASDLCNTVTSKVTETVGQPPGSSDNTLLSKIMIWMFEIH